MANMVMLEWFIEEVCQLAFKQEGFIKHEEATFSPPTGISL